MKTPGVSTAPNDDKEKEQMAQEKKEKGTNFLNVPNVQNSSNASKAQKLQAISNEEKSKTDDKMDKSKETSIKGESIENSKEVEDNSNMNTDLIGFLNYADNVEVSVLEKLSRSQQSADDIIEKAKIDDVEAYNVALKQVEEDMINSGKNYYATEHIEKLLKEFGVRDKDIGLTDEQVVINREKYGDNFIEKERMTPLWKIFLSQYISPVVILLLVAAVASLVLKEFVEGIAIISIVTLNACLATYMEKSSGDAIAKLAEMASPQCAVLRNGKKQIIPSREVVVGDIVYVNTGDSISADLRLFEVNELKTNESLLTGESEDIKKSLVAEDPSTPFATNLCFATTSVTNGCGKGVVFSTGVDTQVGKIATQLKSTNRGSKLTPLQSALNKLGGLIGFIAIIVLVVIIVLAVLTNYRDPAHADKDPIFVIIIIGVGFAVSSIPEGLPMVVTITLSAGAKDMVNKNANVRKLPAVETLGCCSVICSDKTGTLTEGKMTCINTVTVCRNASLTDDNKLTKTFAFYPTKGYDPYGGLFDAKDLTAEKKAKIIMAKNQNVSFDSILYNYGNQLNKSPAVDKTRTLFYAAYLNSYDTSLSKDGKSNKWTIQGNMSEGPIIVAAAKIGYGFRNDVVDSSDLNQEKRLDNLEVTFNSSRKMKITFYELKKENMFENIYLEDAEKKFTHIALIKGAPDKLLDSSTHLLTETKTRTRIDWKEQITNNEKEILKKKNLDLSQEALRVLAICIKPLTRNDIEQLEKLSDAEERLKFVIHDNKNKVVVPLGFIASFDPPRPGVKEAIKTCREASVKVIMITGDQKPTAIAIGKLVGLFDEHEKKEQTQGTKRRKKESELSKEKVIIDDDKKSIVCAELHMHKNPNEPVIPDEELDEMTEHILIYARAQPEDKISIVQSLKRKGYLVAMTGDGVNDAPALKAADIGIAMGINGTEVAKGASEMILMDDNFCTVVSAIDVGRTIYSNIQKFVCFLLGTNIGEIIYLSVAIIAQMPFPLEALQILFLNLMTDGCPAVALSREPPNDDNMQTPPRPKKQPIMTKDWWIYGILPHTIFEALCVLLSLCISLYLCTGSITLHSINGACRVVNVKDVSDHTKFHEFKYFCSNYEYRFMPGYIGWVTNINFWNTMTNETVTFLGAAKGKVENIRWDSNEIHPSIRTIMEKGCTGNVTKDEYGWCMPRADATASGKDAEVPGAFKRGYDDVSSRGSKRGRTMAFITAVWCEMLRAYTVRSWKPFYAVFNRNMWMHLACSLSATLTFLVTCTPGINYVLRTTCLLWWQYLMAVFWALLNLVLDEAIPKVLYRRKYNIK